MLKKDNDIIHITKYDQFLANLINKLRFEKKDIDVKAIVNKNTRMSTQRNRSATHFHFIKHAQGVGSPGKTNGLP